MADDIDALIARTTQHLKDKAGELKAIEQQIYSKRLIAQELDQHIAAKEAEFARQRGKVDDIAEHCQKMIDHAHNTVNTAMSEVNRIVHPNNWESLKGLSK